MIYYNRRKLRKGHAFGQMTDMKNKWKTTVKTIAALILALVLLDLFCFWYYNPAGYDQDESRATDNIREPGAFTSRAKEGIAWATIDENGYNNASVPGEDGVFVLMMGSSHTEGLNVMQHETVPSLLQQYLRDAGMDGFVYNIGISAHNLARNAANFERAMNRFEPSGYVVLETQDVKFHRDLIAWAMDDAFVRLEATEPVISELISDRPLVRTLFRQWMSFSSGVGENDDEAQASEFVITEEMLDQYEAALTELLVKLRTAALEKGAELVIYYHPHLMIQADGSAAGITDEGCLAAFAAACENAQVRFLDMTDVFLQAYAEDGILPHGFSNTAPGVGHLNPRGNALIAQTLCEEIRKLEGKA